MTKLHTVVCVVVETLQQEINCKGYNFMCHRCRYTYPSKLLPNTSHVYIKLIFTALHVGSKEYEFLNSNINWANMNHLVFIVMAFIVLWLIVNCFKLQCIAYNIATMSPQSFFGTFCSVIEPVVSARLQSCQ